MLSFSLTSWTRKNSTVLTLSKRIALTVPGRLTASNNSEQSATLKSLVKQSPGLQVRLERKASSEGYNVHKLRLQRQG